jgi:hypothetical protein
MKNLVCFSAVILFTCLLAGCVTSHYVNDKGFECTRRYFTPLGIPFHSCSEKKAAVAEPGQAQGKELKMPAAAPEPSLRQTTPAKTIAQNIKATTQAFGR